MQPAGSEAWIRTLANIPEELKALPQWVCWAYGRPSRSGRLTKLPFNPRRTARAMARVNDPGTWGSFAEAVARASEGHFDGVGFVFTAGDPYCGIDLDSCRDPATGDIAAWGREFLETLSSYSELSVSGRGLHIILRGRLSGPGNRRPWADGEVEMYDRGRYFVMTGQVLEGRTVIEDRQAQLEAVHRRVFGGAG
ncbi:MAG: hypothetical protein QHH05_02120 [Syntrophomonadaceae bacterium]|nr:hypothetical protein [Syntrophomonadaceae bacterium]